MVRNLGSYRILRGIRGEGNVRPKGEKTTAGGRIIKTTLNGVKPIKTIKKK